MDYTMVAATPVLHVASASRIVDRRILAEYRLVDLLRRIASKLKLKETKSAACWLGELQCHHLSKHLAPKLRSHSFI
jgi:hypothetical protein